LQVRENRRKGPPQLEPAHWTLRRVVFFYQRLGKDLSRNFLFLPPASSSSFETLRICALESIPNCATSLQWFGHWKKRRLPYEIPKLIQDQKQKGEREPEFLRALAPMVW
jgi:hypothetical protein